MKQLWSAILVMVIALLCFGCNARQTDIQGNMDPEPLPVEQRTIHQIMQLEDDPTYDLIRAESLYPVYQKDVESIFCDVTNDRVGKGFYVYETPFLERKVNDEWVRLFNSEEDRFSETSWKFCAVDGNSSEQNSCRLLIHLSQIEPKVEAGFYRFVIFTAEKTLYAEFEIID